MSSHIEEFLNALYVEDLDWEEEAFEWVAQRTWIGWWTGLEIPRSRVYVEKAGPQMRVHP